MGAQSGAGVGLLAVEERVQQALDLYGGINLRTCGLDILCAFYSGHGQRQCWLVTGLNTCLTSVHPDWHVWCSACCCPVCRAGVHMLLRVFSEACTVCGDVVPCVASQRTILVAALRQTLAQVYQASVECQQLADWGLLLAA
jgi:hypothetical protein